jgi:hypothetical protein
VVEFGKKRKIGLRNHENNFSIKKSSEIQWPLKLFMGQLKENIKLMPNSM